MQCIVHLLDEVQSIAFILVLTGDLEHTVTTKLGLDGPGKADIHARR